MDFRSMNKFNVIMNTLSGNFFPMTGKKTSLGFVSTTYFIFTWIVVAIYISSTMIGFLFYVPATVALRHGGVGAIVCVEVVIFAPHLNNGLRNLIGKINSILVNSDALRRCILNNVEPHKARLKIYVVTSLSAVTMWSCLSMFKLLEKDRHSFTYTDFTPPSYFPGAPFTVNVFLCGVLLQVFGATYVMCKKTAIDVYISYLITLLTAEYRYVNEQITDALSQVDGKKNEELVISSLKKCVKHHCNVMEVGKKLTELLTLNVGLTYLNCILRFCFLSFSLVTLPNLQEKVFFMLYMTGNMIQVYMLCLCVQELLDASTTVTDDAFHENWYERGNTVKSIFLTMGLGNRVECRLTAYRIVDLTVPTFASILNKAYSVCLLLLRIC